MKILIKNGRVIDPKSKLDTICDILISDNIITKVAKNIRAKVNKTINAKNCIVFPGLIDIHTHLREPGEERKETIMTGTHAAAKGGVTSVCCMPNTQPVIDTAQSVEYILLKAKNQGVVNVFPIGAITKNLEGKQLTEIGKLYASGVKGITDDGHPIMNAHIMYKTLEYSKQFNIPVISHSEDINLSKNGVMNEGATSTLLGLKGIPKSAEEIMIARDLVLCAETGGHLHIAHVSTANSVELIRQAKKKKINVTAETAPHYFTLTDEAVKNYNTNAKINPPLRTKEDIKAIKKGLIDGTIDCIASDHAPHTEEEKNSEFNIAPFGIIGLETLLSVSYTELITKDKMNITKLISKLTLNPAHVMSLQNRGSLKPGYIADIVVFDPNKTWVVKSFVSKSKNSPFIGSELTGIIKYTIVSGKIVYSI